MSKTEKRKTGDIGEKIAGRFLQSKGFEVVGRNYLKPWGEIDIIAKKKGKIHFVEVKTISRTRVSDRYSISTPFGDFVRTSQNLSKGLAEWAPSHSSPVRNVSDGVRDPRPEEIGFLKKCRIFLSDKLLARPELAYVIREISESEEKGNNADEYRPEDNLHPWKLKRLKRAITSYLSEKRMSEEDDWQFDVITVRVEEKGKTALVEYLEDIIL